VSLPSLSRFAAIVCSKSNASPVTDCSFSSSAKMARQKSEEMTSVLRKCLRAKLDLPEADAPTNKTKHNSGIVIFNTVFFFIVLKK
jgi:hypothetical protein